jgi:Zn-dependent peptidase ImmA (M78 family)
MPLSLLETITSLYAAADLSAPTTTSSPRRQVVLLSELLGGYNLTCTEVAGLTSLAASTFLMQRGALLSPITDANQEPLAGYIYVSKISGHIFVERNDFLVRRRFSIAHELGHYLLHFRPLLTDPLFHEASEPFEISEALSMFAGNDETEDLPAGRVFSRLQANFSSLLPSETQMEEEANQFAAELLMPAEVVRHLVKLYSPVCRGGDLLWRLATDLLVSRSATYRRLQELQLAPLLNKSWS